MKHKITSNQPQRKSSTKKKLSSEKENHIPVLDIHPQKRNHSFPIVAIGASAGGLEAMTQLMQDLPADTGMAFIYVQHLSPDHESILASLLAKNSQIPVQEATDMVSMEPNKLYVIPSDKEMNVVDGKLTLSPRTRGKGVNLLIDVFFTSLAETHKENVIGIILSGSATDGTRGLKEIKFGGGLTFAQDDSAKFNSMPQSAIAAGVVDFILSPKDIAKELVRLSKHPYIGLNIRHQPEDNDVTPNNADLKLILHLLHKTYGVNFALYKFNTIKRRVLRRMLLHKIRSLKEYAQSLQEKKDEIEILFNDLLINVTNFFRDADNYKYYKTSLFPRLLKTKETGETLRIWVTACSTGEEAYSIAMVLLEIQETRSSNIPVQIFATDLSHQVISKARIGFYTKQEVEQVSPTRLQRFFTLSDGGYRIAQNVREMCVFAAHNILSDPPFSRVDFISCCNLLIYFDLPAQKKVLATFHYALKPDGYLALGQSETIGASVQLFSEINKKMKIFSRKKDSGIGMLPTPEGRTTRLVQPVEILSEYVNSSAKIFSNLAGLDQAVNSLLLTRFMPASVVINHQMEILQFRGSTSIYLEHQEGKASLNILKMARPEISFELRNAITKVIKTHKPVQKKGIEMNGGRTLVTLEAAPVANESDDTIILVVFTQQEIDHLPDNIKLNNKDAINERKLIKLEEEIVAYRDQLRSISRHHEAAVEELQTANEEVVSSNEELRSINEELETSKEEIQSANEELATTNQELQMRNELLHESYNYSQSIISTIHDPIIVLDKYLRVKTANKSFYKQFHVTAEETEGILLYDLGGKQWDIPKLRELLEEIIPRNTSFVEFEIEQTFPKIGHVIMRLNAKKIIQPAHQEQLILLAIANVTETVARQRFEKHALEDQIDMQTQIATATNTEIKKQKIQSLEFENAVHERTKELNEANRELAELNLALKKVNKELESFAYVSSHDLQEPLRKIQIFVNLIFKNESKFLSEKGKEYFGRVITSAERMQVLIEDLLAFSRINVGEIKIEVTDLTKIIEDVKSELKEIIDEKKAIIEVKKICDARIIPFQFHQLMQNLLSNSLKFSDPSRPPRIVIESKVIKSNELNIEYPLPDDQYCHIVVSDNGIGFEHEFEEQVFEVFQRLHSQERYPGTGIGLAIAKKIVENHNGVITATSELNEGTRFDIYLPHY